MKSIVLAAALAAAIPAPAAFAGPERPKMTAQNIHVSTATNPASSGGIIIPLLFLVLIAAALSGGGSSGSTMMY